MNVKPYLVIVPVLILGGCNQNLQEPPMGVIPSFTPWPNLKPEKAKQITMDRLKRLGQGIMRYRENHGGAFPDMTNALKMKTAVEPYLDFGGNDVFVHPVTAQMFTSNPALSGLTEAPGDPSTIAMVYENKLQGLIGEKNGGKDTRAVLFADGHCERIDESKWPQVAKTSQIKVW